MDYPRTARTANIPEYPTVPVHGDGVPVRTVAATLTSPMSPPPVKACAKTRTRVLQIYGVEPSSSSSEPLHGIAARALTQKDLLPITNQNLSTLPGRNINHAWAIHDAQANVPEAREHHAKVITNNSIGDASVTVVLTFIGLFSAIVSSFIIESYKMLSPGLGDRTSQPSCQVSQGLGIFPSGTFVPPEASLPPLPSPSIVLVNVMWLLSLVLCIASALLATLKQQRAHGCIRLPQVAMTIYFSVFLFLVGLVIFFFTIYKTVAIVVAITVGLFVMIYLTLTVGPCLLASITCARIVSGVGV